ncbi:MAG TPA: LysE family transporter [Egibacteraceae bacterium]
MDLSAVAGALAAGVAAGLAVAVPLGPVGLLVIDRAARHGLATGVAAGAGVAAADCCYALLAAVAGFELAARVAPAADAVRVVSAVALAALAVTGVVRTVRQPAPTPATPGRAARASAALFGLTLLNPLTVSTFAALVLGLGAGGLTGPGTKAAFVTGVTAASFLWQSLLAVAGAVAGSRLSPRARVVTGLVGNLLVLGLALRLYVG